MSLLSLNADQIELHPLQFINSDTSNIHNYYGCNLFVNQAHFTNKIHNNRNDTIQLKNEKISEPIDLSVKKISSEANESTYIFDNKNLEYGHQNYLNLKDLTINNSMLHNKYQINPLNTNAILNEKSISHNQNYSTNFSDLYIYQNTELSNAPNFNYKIDFHKKSQNPITTHNSSKTKDQIISMALNMIKGAILSIYLINYLLLIVKILNLQQKKLKDLVMQLIYLNNKFTIGNIIKINFRKDVNIYISSLKF